MQPLENLIRTLNETQTKQPHFIEKPENSLFSISFCIRGRKTNAKISIIELVHLSLANMQRFFNVPAVMKI